MKTPTKKAFDSTAHLRAANNVLAARVRTDTDRIASAAADLDLAITLAGMAAMPIRRAS